MSELMQEAKKGNHIVTNVSNLANIKLYLQRVFINQGHLKTTSAKLEAQQYFKNVTLNYKSSKATFFEKVFYYQSCYWYHFLIQNYQQCNNYAKKWVQLYEEEANMIEADVDMYLRAVHHLFNTTFFIKNTIYLEKEVSRFIDFVDEHAEVISLNAFIHANLFSYQAQFNQYFLNNQFKKGLQIVPAVLAFIEKYEYQLDNYKTMILYYKIASCYLGTGAPSKTIDFVNLIINQSGKALREDILRFSRLLGILAHYELNNFTAVEYLINAIERQLVNSIQPDQLSQSTITFFKKLIGAIPNTKHLLFKSFYEEIRLLKQKPEEGRAFIFLDMQKWIEYKVKLGSK